MAQGVVTKIASKTGNSWGHNNVIRKRVPNINDPITKEVTVSF